MYVKARRRSCSGWPQRVRRPSRPRMLAAPPRYNHHLKRVITAQDVPPGGEFRIPLGSIVTPSAREVAAARGVRIVELPSEQIVVAAAPERTIAIGADHGGFRLKQTLKTLIEDLGFDVRDIGVHEEKAV